MKKAILGGSFNPIHNGHLMMAECAHKQFDLDDIIVIPNKTTYYKKNKVFVSDEHRINMIKLAIEDKTYLSFSDMEIVRGGVTHTIDTIHEFQRLYPGVDLYFIIGGDSLEWVDRWVSAEELLSSVIFLSAVRGDTDKKRSLEIIKRIQGQYPESKIELLDMEDYPISSSDIRDKIKNGEDVREMLPEAVYKYIIQNGCYL